MMVSKYPDRTIEALGKQMRIQYENESGGNPVYFYDTGLFAGRGVQKRCRLLLLFRSSQLGVAYS